MLLKEYLTLALHSWDWLRLCVPNTEKRYDHSCIYLRLLGNRVLNLTHSRKEKDYGHF